MPQGGDIHGYRLLNVGIDPNGSAVKKSEHITILGNKEQRYTAGIPVPSLDGIAGVAGETVPALFEDIIYDCNISIQYWVNRIVTFGVPHRALLVSTR